MKNLNLVESFQEFKEFKNISIRVTYDEHHGGRFQKCTASSSTAPMRTLLLLSMWRRATLKYGVPAISLKMERLKTHATQIEHYGGTQNPG
jgi:hypothetical protein